MTAANLSRYFQMTLILMVFAAGLAGCAGRAVVQTDISGPSGVELWTENCMRCHNMRSPADLRAAEWDIAVHHMRVRANLTASEASKVADFLRSSSQ